MKKVYNISNSFLIYSTVCLSILIYIFGVFALINVVKEASQIGFIDALSENITPTILGMLCLFLAAPSYRLTKSLRILEITEYDNGPAILTPHIPLFRDDMPQPESKTTVENIKEVSQNNYFNRLVKLRLDENGSERIIKSFINHKSLERLTKSA
jgi:hypothetical protein